MDIQIVDDRCHKKSMLFFRLGKIKLNSQGKWKKLLTTIKIGQIMNHMPTIGLEQEMIWTWCTLDISLKQMLETV